MDQTDEWKTKIKHVPYTVIREKKKIEAYF